MVTRLSDGLTPGDGSDPRTFPSIWNVTADTIESQGSAITAAESDIDTLQSDVTAAESDIDALEAKNIPSFGTATPSDGDVLTFDSGASEYVPEAPAAGGGGAVNNLLYNGAMQVAQRGTSETGITSDGYYTADRWNTFVNLGTYTQTVEADGPTGSGFTKSLKLECTTSASLTAGANVNVRQFLEGQDLQALKKGTSSAESLNLSFWVKSNVTGTYRITLNDNDNSRQVGATYSISASGTWEKKTILLPPDTTGALDNDNANSLTVAFYLVAGTNLTSGAVPTAWEAFSVADLAAGLDVSLAASTGNYWQVTGVQLETGTVASGFDHKPYGVELAECQRYYFLIADQNGQTISNAGAYNTTIAFGAIHPPVTMRNTPSLDVVTGSGYYSFPRNGGSDLVDDFSLNSSSPSVINIFNDSDISSTAGHYGQFRMNNSSAYIALDAEL